MDDFHNPPPDSLYAQAVDNLFAAFDDGDEGGAATALRAAGRLSGFSLGYFADLLDPAVEHQNFSWCIRLSKISKGRPTKHLSTKQSRLFLRYLAAGKAQQAAKVLRSRKILSAPETKILADLFCPTTACPEGFAFRLRFASTRIGRPTNKLKRAARDFYWRRLFAGALDASTADAKEKKQLSVGAKVHKVFKILGARQKKEKELGKKPRPLPSPLTVKNHMKRLGFLPHSQQK